MKSWLIKRLGGITKKDFNSEIRKIKAEHASFIHELECVLGLWGKNKNTPNDVWGNARKIMETNYNQTEEEVILEAIKSVHNSQNTQ